MVQDYKLKASEGGIKLQTVIAPFWYRRSCQAILLGCLGLLGLFIANLLGLEDFYNGRLAVGWQPALLAGLAAMAAAAGALGKPSSQSVQKTAWAAYGLFILATGVTVLQTGGVDSPFMALWLLLGVFSGLFGAWALIFMALLVNGYIAYLALVTAKTEALAILALIGELPLVISYTVWRGQSGQSSEKDKAFSALAAELTQVAGKSEIVINAIADGVMAIDGRGVIDLLNPAAQQILGWTKQDALGLDYRSVLKLSNQKSEPLAPDTDPVQLVLTTNQTVATDDLVLTTNSDKKLQVSLMVSPVGSGGAGAIIVFRDITAKKTEERQQAEFISTASHEMRTPVATIEGYLGLALNPKTATIDDKAKEYLQKAQESVQHLGRLFQDLLDVSKAEDGRLNTNPVVVDIVAFTKEVTESFELSAKQKGLVLYFKPVSSSALETNRRLNPVYYALADQGQLREVLSNLIENAIKYTQTGSITVDIGGNDEAITVSVADTGIGIPPEDIPHLFQKFYRIDNSVTREIGGTGLGLYLCRRLVEAMRGRIWVKSEFGRGSTFYVQIPRLTHEEAMERLAQSGNLEAADSANA